jgi:hypothetical protein
MNVSVLEGACMYACAGCVWLALASRAQALADDQTASMLLVWSACAPNSARTCKVLICFEKLMTAFSMQSK